jgi:hypothetical protein
MKRLLLLLDSDPMPNAYDIIVGYDGGADHIVSYGSITPDNVGALIDGAVFTRGSSEKKHTAVFIGGANMAAGEDLLAAVNKRFFGNFRASVMLDSNVQIPRLLQELRRSQRGSLSQARRWWYLLAPDRSVSVPPRFSPRKERK